MKYIGIDPGKKGGIALIDDDKNIYSLNVYSAQSLIKLIKQNIYDDIICILEKVWGFPGERGQFNFGANYGEIIGILKALDVDFKLITPQKWKKYYGLNADKRKSINKASELYPHANLIPKNKQVEHDGVAEALLIAEYGRCNNEGYAE